VNGQSWRVRAVVLPEGTDRVDLWVAGGRLMDRPRRGAEALPGGWVLPGLLDALAAASTAARRYLGRPGLETGAPADLVCYPADRRNDPEVLRHPSAILVAGQRVRISGDSSAP
jgi:imidazolonepropionase-like amidohydrolase